MPLNIYTLTKYYERSGENRLAIGIPLSIRASKGMIQAVEIYNSNLNGTYFEQGLLIRLGVTSSGVGLKVDF